MEEVKKLLEGIDFGCYVPKFEEEGWDDLETVLSMSENDIKTCIPKPGHARKLYNKIQQVLSERKEGNTVEKKVKLSNPVFVGEGGSHEDGSTTSEALLGNEMEASDLDIGKTQPDNTLQKNETSKVKCDRAAKSEAISLDVQKETHEEHTKVDRLTGSANHNLVAAREDILLAQTRETCDEVCRKEEDISQPIQELVTSASLRTQRIPRESLNVCGEEMRTYRGDMPLCTYVSDSENVTIAKNVKIQHVTKHFESGQSKYKGQIQSVLDSIEEKHRNLIVETRAFAEVNDILDDRFWAVITGNAGEGKTTMGRHLLRQHRKKGYEPLIVTTVDDWKNLVDGKRNEKEKQFVLIDDIFGTISVDERKVSEWASMFELIDKLLTERKGDLKVVCTVRTLIYSEVETKVSRFECFKKIRMVNISDEQFALQEEEKSQMLEKYLKYYNIELNLFEIQQINADQHSHGFPHCLEMFCTNLSFREKGLDFFLNPLKMLENEFENLYESDKHKFCALVMLIVAAVKNIQVSLYSDDDQKASLLEIAVKLSETPETKIHDINIAFNHLRNTYINISDDDDNIISFRHPSFYEMVSIVVTRRNPVFAVEVLDIKFLAFRTKSHGYKKNMLEDYVLLPKACNKILVMRFSQALLLPYIDVLRHNAWSDADFINQWMSHVTQRDKNEECILFKLLQLEFLNYLTGDNDFLLSLFALNEHEQIIKRIVQYQSLQHFWSSPLGTLQLSRALISASSSDCSVNFLKVLVQFGADIDYCIQRFFGTEHINALYCAVESNHFEKTKTLLKCGVSSLFLSETNSVFILAIHHQNMDIFMLLLNYMKTHQSCDAPENNSHKHHLLYGKNYTQLLSSHLEEILFFDLKKLTENPAFLKDLLICLCNIGITLSEKKVIDIVMAGSTGNIEQVMGILNTTGYCFDNIWKSSEFSWFLKTQNPVELLEVLQRYGLKIDSRDVRGNTLLHYIPYGNMQEKDNLLLNNLLQRGISVDLPNRFGKIPVQFALQYFKPMSDCTEDVLKLIELSDVCRVKDNTGKNCFHFLAMSRNTFSQDILERVIDLLLLKDCDINEVDNEGKPPLFFCNLGLLKMFIEKGAIPFFANRNKMTIAMEIIHRNEHNILDMLSILCNCGLNLTMTDANGRNLLHYVSESTYGNTVKQQLFDFLINKGVDVNGKDINQITPLMTVVQNPMSTMRFVCFAIQNGASVTEKDNDSFTMFHHCIRSSMPEQEKRAILDNLLMKDINVDSVNLFKYAMEYAETSIIISLLNGLSLPVETVFDICKSSTQPDCQQSIHTLCVLLRFRYWSDFMDLLEKEKDFQVALFRDICMNCIDCDDLFEFFPKGINIEWLNTVEVPPYFMISCNSEKLRKFFICKDNGSLEYNLCKRGLFHLLYLILSENNQWVVCEIEFPEIIFSLALCADDYMAKFLLKTLFKTKENCSFYKLISYSVLKHWCKQPDLHPSCIRLLLLHGDTNIVDEKDESLVFFVIRNLILYRNSTKPVDHTALVKELIKYNFKCDVPNINGVTPLMFLILNSDTRFEPLIDILISMSENLSHKDNNGCNILHYLAISALNDERKAILARNLIEKGVPIVKNSRGEAPFHVLFHSLHPKYISTLTCFVHSNIKKHDLIDLLQNSIKHAGSGYELTHQFINLFEETKLNAKTDVDITGSTFLAQSSRCISSGLVSYFIKKGSDLNQSDILGCSPIHRIFSSHLLIACSVYSCVYFEEDDFAEAVFQMRTHPWCNVPKLDELLDLQKADIHSICLTAVNCALECLHMLLSNGADPNIMDVNGKTPLHFCAESTIFDAFTCPAMRMLISHGADVNREDFKGRTPLMLCLQFEKSRYRRLNILIKAKAIFCTNDYNYCDLFHYGQEGIRKRVCWLNTENKAKEREFVNANDI